MPNLDDPPTADELAVRWRAHARVASDLGNRARLKAAAVKVKYKPTT
jgi:hypothetical protein